MLLGYADLDLVKQKLSKVKQQIERAFFSWDRTCNTHLAIDLAHKSSDIQEYGYKYARLIEQAHFLSSIGIASVKVPMPRGIANHQLIQFLTKQAPKLAFIWCYFLMNLPMWAKNLSASCASAPLTDMEKGS